MAQPFDQATWETNTDDGRATVNHAQFLNDYFGGRLGGGELYLPDGGAEEVTELLPVTHDDLVRQFPRARDYPTRMARNYYLQSLKGAAPQIIRDLAELRTPLQAALNAELSDPAKWIDGEPPARGFTGRWLFEYYIFSLWDGQRWLSIYEPSPLALDFVNRLSDFARKYYLELWIVRALMEALGSWLLMPEFELGTWLGEVTTSHSCPLEPERHRYVARDNPEQALKPEVRRHKGAGRVFVFEQPGYRPTGVRQSQFMQICREQFEEALRHYVEGVEREYMALGYVPSPEMRDLKKFEWAVLRRNLKCSLEQIEDRYYVTRSAISEGIKEVERAMRVAPLKARMTKNAAQKRGRRVPK